jgi:hypothetical protein
MLDAYVAIAMALVHALNTRDFRRGGGVFGVQLDRLRLYNRSNRNAILTALVEDGLFSLPAVPLRREAENDADSHQARYGGDQVGNSTFSRLPPLVDAWLTLPRSSLCVQRRCSFSLPVLSLLHCLRRRDTEYRGAV